MVQTLLVTNTTKKAKSSITRTKLDMVVDLGLALAFVIELERHFTGLLIHELLGVTMGIGLILHIVLHWRWVISITKTFFHNLLHESRFNYVLNLALFIDMLVIIATGIAISRNLGLNLGLDRSLSSTFERLHILASSFSLMLVGVHVAIHWKWIVSNVSRLFRVPFQRQRHAAATTAVSFANDVQIISEVQS